MSRPQIVKEATLRCCKVASIKDEMKENRDRIHLWMANFLRLSAANLSLTQAETAVSPRYTYDTTTMFLYRIIISPLVEDVDEQNARTVLYLFLAPADEKDSVEQREIIRANTTQQTLDVISEKAKVPVSFVEYLVLNENEEAAP